MTSTIPVAVEGQLEWRAKHKLAVLRHVEKVIGEVAVTCRDYNISRQAYYYWLRRYEAGGVERLRDRSSAPHYSPTATNVEVLEKILWLRQQYHRRAANFGRFISTRDDVLYGHDHFDFSATRSDSSGRQSPR